LFSLFAFGLLLNEKSQHRELLNELAYTSKLQSGHVLHSFADPSCTQKKTNDKL
jgi:hypothetical protein